MRPLLKNTISLAVCALLSGVAAAQQAPDMGKLLATGGVSSVEGAGGGGISPWALITGYGTRDSYGANVHATSLTTQDYALFSYGFAVGIADRFEASLAKQQFRGTGAALDGVSIGQDIVGLKLRVAGDALYGQDTYLPQIAVGLMAKRNTGISGLGAVTSVKQLGAKEDSGIDYYVSATKLFLEHRLLLNGTLRATKANQMGLLGFGGDLHDRYQYRPEVSVAYLINRSVVAGAEYRVKPHDNLSVDKERDYYDVFVAYLPTKNVSITAAYAELGAITVLNPKRQHGLYLSLQAGF